MSKDIDFEFGRGIGATHYSLGDDDYHFAWIRFGAGFKEIYVPAEGSHAKWFISRDWDREIIAIPPVEPWTIHSNTLPTEQLTDEQYGKMRRAEESGGEVEFMRDGEWIRTPMADWHPSLVYRIKPKSEHDSLMESIEELFRDGDIHSDIHKLSLLVAKVIEVAIRGEQIKAPEVSK